MNKILADLDHRLITRQEAESLTQLLYNELNAGFEKMKEFVSSLTYQTWKMRQCQNQYFAGDKSALSASKNFERVVDDKIAAIMKRPGMSADELALKYEPKKLF